VDTAKQKKNIFADGTTFSELHSENDRTPSPSLMHHGLDFETTEKAEKAFATKNQVQSRDVLKRIALLAMDECLPLDCKQILVYAVDMCKKRIENAEEAGELAKRIAEMVAKYDK
jgi:hypothetical protein